MTPSDLRSLASRVETEEPSEELRAAVLTAFGSEAEWLTAPNPLRSVDDAKAFQPEGWSCLVVQNTNQDGWQCELWRPTILIASAPTEPRARTAASLRALAWEKENADG